MATGTAVAQDYQHQYQRAQQELQARGYVQFHPLLAATVGGFKPALMLGHALYWTRHWLTQHPERDNWFWKTATEWRDAVGLSQREQESARANLREANVWSEHVAGAPARLFYRVELGQLTARLQAHVTQQPSLTASEPGTSGDWRLVQALLGRPIYYYRPLADIAGSAAAGLVLSGLLADCRSALRDGSLDARGFFATAVEDSRLALGIGAKVQRNAREALRRAGLLQEAWTQEQRPRMLARLNLTALSALLTAQSGVKLPKRYKAKAKAPISPAMELVPVQGSLLAPLGAGAIDLPDRALVVGQDGNVTQVMRLLASRPLARSRARAPAPQGDSNDRGATRHDVQPQDQAQQQLTDVKGCPFVETEPSRVALFANQGLPFSRTSIQRGITKRTPTARAREEQPDDPRRSRRSRGEEPSKTPEPAKNSAAPEAALKPNPHDLVLPKALAPALHHHALTVVAAAPSELQQALLDELAGHLQMRNKTIANPVGWLHALVSKAVDGSLVLTLADGVAQARAARAAHESRLAQAVQTSASPSQPDAPADEAPVKSEAVIKHQRKLKALADEMRLKSSVVNT